MKKYLVILLIVLLSVNLIGCTSEETFNFNYTLRKDYTGEIGEGLAEAFIEFTKDTVNLYETAFEEFEEYYPEETEHNPMEALDILDIDNYMYDVTTMYQEFDYWNGQEKQMLKFMEEQREVVADLALLKLQYSTYTIDKDNGEKTEHTLEYLNRELESSKLKTEENLENAKVFIN